MTKGTVVVYELPNMTIDRRRFRAMSLVILGAHVCAIGAFLVLRSPLHADQWAFIERHRPAVIGTSFILSHDGLNLALARRPVGGGWESAPVRLFQILNLPAYLSALTTFQLLQAKPGGTAKLHSDLATAMFGAIALFQWRLIALLLSMRRVRT
jgi:hypothetical protein